MFSLHDRLTFLFESYTVNICYYPPPLLNLSMQPRSANQIIPNVIIGFATFWYTRPKLDYLGFLSSLPLRMCSCFGAAVSICGELYYINITFYSFSVSLTKEIGISLNVPNSLTAMKVLLYLIRGAVKFV